MMKRQMIMASAALILLSATAGAQQWDGEGYTYRLKGCYVERDQVRCDITYVLTESPSTDFELYARDYTIVTTDGKVFTANHISAGGRDYSTYNTSVAAFKDAPVQVSLLFNVSGYTSFKVFAVGKIAMNNVPIAKSASAATPVVTTPAPSAGVPTGFGLQLSNCKVNKGIYTCTATLTPTR